MTDLASISQVKPREVPSGIRSVYFEVSSREIPGLVADLDPAQPFDADVAFPARHHQPQRIALLGPQRLAVLRVDDETIVEAFVERQAAVHVRAVGAFDHDPLRLLLDADLFQQRGEPDAGPFRAADHAVGELQRIDLRGAPLHAAVGRAFDEMDARHRRKAHDVVHRQQQRTLDQAVDHQPVLVRIDVRPPGVIALEEQAVRRDDAVQSCSGEKLTEDSVPAVSQGTLRRITPASVSAGRP